MNNAWGVFKRQWSVEAQFLNQNLRKNYYRLPLSAVVSKCKQWNIELKHYEYQSTTYRGLFPFHPALFRSVRENTFEWKIFVHDCVTYHTHRVIILVGEFVWVYFIASRKWLEMAYKPRTSKLNHICRHMWIYLYIDFSLCVCLCVNSVNHLWKETSGKIAFELHRTRQSEKF